MIVGWSIGGILGPLLVAALIEGEAYTTAFTTIAVIAFASIILPLITRAPGVRPTRGRTAVADGAPQPSPET